MRSKWIIIVNADDQILALCGSALSEWADHQLASLRAKFPGVAIRLIKVTTDERPKVGQFIKDIKNIVIARG